MQSSFALRTVVKTTALAMLLVVVFPQIALWLPQRLGY